MIIIGYQGIGKTTLTSVNQKYIDLESSNFWFKDKDTGRLIRHSNWFDIYCNIAEDLSKNGYIVFVSSHRPVRERLKKSNEEVIVCVPSIHLKEQWINKLKKRYESSGLSKDYKAYMNAVDRYEDNIVEIVNSGFKIISILTMDYDLDRLIQIGSRG